MADHVTLRLTAAAADDLQAAFSSMAKEMLKLRNAFGLFRKRNSLMEQERAAYAAFVKDGGEPSLIHTIEEAYDVDTVGFPTST